MDAIRIPTYEPRCERCGHGPDYHSTTACEHGKPIRNLYLQGLLACDCSGWKRDESWPPPVIVERVA